MGIIVALVLWVVTMALIYALIQSQAGSGALTGVVRTTAMRSVLFAGRSALTEASYVVRHPPRGSRDPLERLVSGSTSADPFEPVGTLQLYRELIARGQLEVGHVECNLASRPASEFSTEPWMIDLSVRISAKVAGSTVTRRVVRRHLGRLHTIRATVGSSARRPPPGPGPRPTPGPPARESVLATWLVMQPEPLLEVTEP